MKIMVVGGAGFIGSHIVDGYHQAGHEVVILDNLTTGRYENIQEIAHWVFAGGKNHEQVPYPHFYECDLTDRALLERVLIEESPEVVNHHAAQMDVRVSTVMPDFDAQVNVVGSVNLLQACVKAGVKKVIYASTGGAVYGEPRCKASGEPDLPVRETHPIRPISPYGISKHTVEHYLEYYRHRYGLNYTVLRYPNVYGPRQRPDGEAGVIAIFAGQLLRGERCTIYGDGSSTRDYVFVSDIVRANKLALTQGTNEIYNLGSGEETSVTEIYEHVFTALKGYSSAFSSSRSLPTFLPARPGEVSRICLDAFKASGGLGWLPEVDLREGIHTTVAVLKAAAS